MTKKQEMTKKNDENNITPAPDSVEPDRRGFLKQAGAAASGVIAVGMLGSRGDAQAKPSVAALAAQRVEKGNVQQRIASLAQLQHEDVARGAITNAAIGIAKNLGGAASDFGLSFGLSWFPAGSENIR